MTIDTATTLLNTLQTQAQSSDVEGGFKTLNKLKILLIDAQNPQELTVKLAALEYGVLLSVADTDMEAFQRNMAQAKALYVNGSCKLTDQSYKILGLNLLYLLVSNNLSEFHSELELLQDSNDAMNSAFIQFPLKLEQRLMVGSYDMVSLEKVPDPSYAFFMEGLMLTVRDSIAECLESAYRTLPLTSAQSMLGFATMEELREYMKETKEDDWIVDEAAGELCFQPPPVGRQASDIPSMKFIAQSLTYATELERIV